MPPRCFHDASKIFTPCLHDIYNDIYNYIYNDIHNDIYNDVYNDIYNIAPHYIASYDILSPIALTIDNATCLTVIGFAFMQWMSSRVGIYAATW
jgi:hypothetical protein